MLSVMPLNDHLHRYFEGQVFGAPAIMMSRYIIRRASSWREHEICANNPDKPAHNIGSYAAVPAFAREECGFR